VPPSPIPKSIATPSLLAYIIGNKYVLAVPLYRQEQLFEPLGIDINRTTMANWMIQSASILERLLVYLKAALLQQTALHADETPLYVNLPLYQCH
jgi:transposase